jgi:predicted NACHT family NTPase
MPCGTMQIVVRQFEICGFPESQPFIEYLLERGRAIVMFDGLDEVLQDNNQRARLTTLINNFSKQYFISQVLVTCRIAVSEYTFDNFQDIELADFTDKQIDIFVSKWFHSDLGKYKKFKEQLNNHCC